MKKLTCALVLGVFGSCSLLAWAMLTLMFNIKNAGRALPYFTNLCIALRPVLIALPVVAMAYYLWLWFRKEEKISLWMGFVVATMTALIVFVLPAMSTSYLLMIDQVKIAIGAR
jgi:drug/metabolite transporter superfamily protein YnfA